eukprot:TRINITY_DN18556_c0_g1_i1.p1 TRINITY_DN18556_c0_g1~~TRINITY_DN18556_c0_g1_i1.p1  ORF type:complete len:357 (-),score=47.64 TRINITY_DN18556_c0_g1_i1:147-1184(-)
MVPRRQLPGQSCHRRKSLLGGFLTLTFSFLSLSYQVVRRIDASFVGHRCSYSSAYISRRCRTISRYAVADPWGLLGISPDSDRGQIKRAFREKIRIAHPDAGGSAEAFKRVRDAYQAALEQVGKPVGLQRQTADRRSAEAQAPERAGWSINDFYKWRREQVDREKVKWEADANFEDQSWDRSSSSRSSAAEQGAKRKWWPGAEEHEHRKRQAEASRDSDFFRGERDEFEDKYPPRNSRTATQAEIDEAERRRRHEKNKQRLADHRGMEELGTGDWAQFLNARKRGESKEDRQKKVTNSPKNNDRVVNYRTVNTRSGSVKVPVYQARNGERYYNSPFTSKRVNIPG